MAIEAVAARVLSVFVIDIAAFESVLVIDLVESVRDMESMRDDLSCWSVGIRCEGKGMAYDESAASAKVARTGRRNAVSCMLIDDAVEAVRGIL